MLVQGFRNYVIDPASRDLRSHDLAYFSTGDDVTVSVYRVMERVGGGLVAVQALVVVTRLERRHETEGASAVPCEETQYLLPPSHSLVRALVVAAFPKSFYMMGS